MASLIDQIAAAAVAKHAADKNAHGVPSASAILASGGVPPHNDIPGKDGGQPGEYYHLTDDQHTDLTDEGNSALHYHATDRDRANHTGTQAATTVVLDRIGSSTYSTVQDLQNIFHSAGWVSGGNVTDNGDGTCAVALVTGAIRATDSGTATIQFFDAAAVASLALTDLSFNWVYVDYNAGTPTITASTTEPTEHHTKIKLAAIYRNGTELHINQTVRYEIGDHAANMVRQMQEVMPYAHVDGAAISESGTRNLNLSAGAFWNGLSRFTTAALDTSVTGSFSTWYKVGATWTKTLAQTQIDNTQYNDTASGLVALTSNRYVNQWVYLATDGDVNVIYGQAQFVQISDAQTESAPAATPSELQVDSFLIGRIIMRQGTATFIQVNSAFQMAFNLSQVTDVSELAGLGTGVATFLGTPSSANLAAAVTDETGSGALVFGTTPTLATPVLANPSFSGTTANLGTVTTADINGGTLDGVVIGGASAAAATVTTLSATGLASFTGGQTITLSDAQRAVIDGTTSAPNLLNISGTISNSFANSLLVDNVFAPNGAGVSLNAFRFAPTYAPSGGTLATITGVLSSPTLDNAIVPATLGGFTSNPNLSATSGGAITNMTQFAANTPTVTAGSTTTLTNYYAFNAGNLTSISATLAASFRGLMSAGTGKWNTYNLGTAINYMNGALLLGTTTDNTVDKLQVNGSTAQAGTITAPGTTGNRTINKPCGRVNIAAGGTTITVTNSLVTANTLVFPSVATNDTTAQIKNVVAGAGSFVINMAAAVTAETAINFHIINVI